MNELSSYMSTLGQINILLPSLAKTLNAFYDPVSDGFRSKIRESGRSIISHARCVESSLSTPAPSLSEAKYQSDEERRKQLNVLLDETSVNEIASNSENGYPASVVIPGIAALVSAGYDIKDPKQVAALGKIVTLLMDRIKSALDSTADADTSKRWQHAMFLYRYRKALYYIREVLRGPLGTYLSVDTTRLETELYEFMREKLYYYLSMSAAISDNEEDALQLGYLIYSLHRYDSGKFKNDVIIEHAAQLVLDTLFRENRSPRIQTIVRDKNWNISASPIEVLSLFSAMHHVRRRFPRFCKAYETAYNWLRTTQREEQVNGTSIQCWMAEPWRGVTETEAWINAHVVDFMVSYRDLLGYVCGDLLITEFGATTERPMHTWEELLDSYGFKRELDDNFIKRIRTDYKKGEPLSKSSIILFGPPGTAKTSVARAISWALGWPFIEFDAHHFAEEGMDGIIRRAHLVFDKLMVMRACVVLFDEIDEMVSVRETEKEKIGRFITSSVLPWFQRLKDKKQIVFVVATNNISFFDNAIKRPGRFDYILPIGPPDEEDRKRLINDQLSKQLRIREYAKEKVADTSTKGASIIIEALPKCMLGADKKEEEDKATPVPWQITIGEIKSICEEIASIIVANGGNVEKNPIVKVLEKASQRPLISKSDYVRFDGEKDRYRYPPLVRK